MAFLTEFFLNALFTIILTTLLAKLVFLAFNRDIEREIVHKEEEIRGRETVEGVESGVVVEERKFGDESKNRGLVSEKKVKFVGEAAVIHEFEGKFDEVEIENDVIDTEVIQEGGEKGGEVERKTNSVGEKEIEEVVKRDGGLGEVSVSARGVEEEEILRVELDEEMISGGFRGELGDDKQEAEVKVAENLGIEDKVMEDLVIGTKDGEELRNAESGKELEIVEKSIEGLEIGVEEDEEAGKVGTEEKFVEDSAIGIGDGEKKLINAGNVEELVEVSGIGLKQKYGVKDVGNSKIGGLQENVIEEMPKKEHIAVIKHEVGEGFDTGGEIRGEEREEGGLVSEDEDWEGIERSDVEKQFVNAAKFVGSGESNDLLSKLSSDVQMQLHGLFKVATEGPCHENAPLALMISSRAKWCHRLTLSSNHSAIIQLTSQFNSCGNQKNCPASGTNATVKDLFTKSLHSWVYPQSSLPLAVISALNLSARQGEVDFLVKRQQLWEDSFRSIYYMLRKNICSLFYVCTSQFVVMFTGGDCLGKTKRICNAYISQSTRGLRSLLREHDVPFSMPLCHSQAEHATAEDLVELFEIGKHNLSQTRRVDSVSDVDNCPESLLAFTGNESVHGLYDFLLNYRSFLSTLVGVDVPVLYAPVPFQNASASVLEVKCKEMKRASSAPALGREPHIADSELCQDLSSGVCYSIEIKDTILPPWTVSGICSSMGSDGRCFEASFVSDPVSIGLNFALHGIGQQAGINNDLEKGLSESNETFGVTEAVVAPCLRAGSLRGLKYSNGSYTACISPL